MTDLNELFERTKAAEIEKAIEAEKPINERPGVLIDDNEVVNLLAQSRKNKKPTTERACLGYCGEKFMSSGIHHRICDGCRNLAPWKSGASDDMIPRQTF